VGEEEGWGRRERGGERGEREREGPGREGRESD